MMEFNSSTPIYLQLMTAIQLKIVSGQLKAGDKIPSVRELALQYQVNPNTMQKALSELERIQLLYTQRTSGRFVTEDADLISQLRRKLAQTQMDVLIQNLKDMGYSNPEIIQLITGYLEEMK